VLPFIEVKNPPTSKCPLGVSSTLSTVSLARPQPDLTAPVEALTLARWSAEVWFTLVKRPPMYAVAQLELSAMESASALASGFQDVTVYGALALKLKTLFRWKVVPFQLIWLNLPTA
jgi:hypothetical protein